MTWLPVILVLVVIVGLYALKRISFVPAERARQFLREGALVVDVRSPGEFNGGHLPGAVNIPLGSLGQEAPRVAPDKSRVLLLHCLSGTRSGMAQRQLKALGYLNAYNLGSYGRAEGIVQSSHQPGDPADKETQ